MNKAGLVLMIGLGALFCFSGCGFKEGAGATVTIVRETPTPTPTPTPEATPTPEPTPTPAIETEQTPGGITVQKIPGNYVTTADINLRRDASQEAEIVQSVLAGTELTGTGVCDNGWIQVSFDGQTVYASGEFVAPSGAGEVQAAPEAEQVVEVVDNVVVEG